MNKNATMQFRSMHINTTSSSNKGYCGGVCNDARISDSAKRLGWPFAGLLGGIGIMGTDA